VDGKKMSDPEIIEVEEEYQKLLNLFAKSDINQEEINTALIKFAYEISDLIMQLEILKHYAEFRPLNLKQLKNLVRETYNQTGEIATELPQNPGYAEDPNYYQITEAIETKILEYLKKVENFGLNSELIKKLGLAKYGSRTENGKNPKLEYEIGNQLLGKNVLKTEII
jgi:hypothetical protein